MTSESAKAKPRKSGKSQQSVLGSLPATRPERIGRRGETRTAPTKPRASATKSRASKPAATKPSAAKASTKSSAAKPRAAAPPPRAERPRRSTPPTGPELVTTALQAAGELAQIGLTVGGQVLRRAARRLPRP